MSANEKLFNALIKTRKKMDLLYKDSDKFNYDSKDKKDVVAFSNVFHLLELIYSEYSAKNNQIKNIDFQLVKLLLNNTGSPQNYCVNINDSIISYKENKVEITSLHGDITIITYKKNAEGKLILLSKSIAIAGSHVNELAMIEDIKELDLALTRTREFQNNFIAILKDSEVQEFVSQYKENRELLTVVFLYVSNEIKFRLFKEIKKQDKALCMDDVGKIITLLKNASKADKEYKYDINDISLPKGWYNALTLEKCIEENKMNFDFIKTLFTHNLLDEELRDNNRDSNQMNKLKI